MLYAQQDTLWTRSFGGSAGDYGESAIQTSDGGFIFIGRTTSFGNGHFDFWLIKTNSIGDQIWEKTFGGNQGDMGYSVEETFDGGYILLGFTESFGNGDQDIWLIKTDSEGNEEWNNTYGGINSDRGYSVKQTLDGGFICVGYTISFGNGDNDIWLIKTDSQGNEEWNRTFGGSNGDYGYSVSETDDGGFVIVGYTFSFGSGHADVWLIKTDSQGNEEWNRTFGGSGDDRGQSVKQTSDGGFIIVGYTFSFGSGYVDVWLIKTNFEGNEEWNSTFGGIDGDFGYSVEEANDGGYMITGFTESFGIGNRDIWLVKTNSDGVEEWNNMIGGDEYDIGKSIRQTTSGDFIIAGFTQSFGNGDNDFWLIKYGSIEGCTDQNAINFDQFVSINDGSCFYIEDINLHFQQVWQGIPLNPMGIYVNSATLDIINLRVGDEIGVFDENECIGMIQLTEEITSPIQIFLSQDNPDTPEIDGFISGGNISYKFWDASEQIEVINVSSTLLNGNDVFTPLGFSEVELQVNSILGCTEINSINYNPEATINDGSCIPTIIGCNDSEACNYDPEANEEGSCVYYDCADECDGSSYVDDCDVCDDDPSNDNECYGCMDLWALNYDPSSTINDDSCEYPSIGDISMDGLINVNDIVLLVGVVLDGEYYIEYMDINQDSYLNIIDIVILVDIILNPEYLGCTDPNAGNYNPEALYSDGSCDYSYIVDIDGNVYSIIVIGEQQWMGENLRVSHYRNGDPIPTGFNGNDWGNLDVNQTGAYSLYEDDPTNGELFGFLFNWFAVDDERGICPESWHIPSDDEWMELEMYLGMSYEEAHDTSYRGTDQGSQLAGNGNLWEDGDLMNDSAFGSSGFIALPDGYRNDNDGNYHSIGNVGYFWSYSVTSSDEAWYRLLHYSTSEILRLSTNKRCGFSVRCIMD